MKQGFYANLPITEFAPELWQKIPVGRLFGTVRVDLSPSLLFRGSSVCEVIL